MIESKLPNTIFTQRDIRNHSTQNLIFPRSTGLNQQNVDRTKQPLDPRTHGYNTVDEQLEASNYSQMDQNDLCESFHKQLVKIAESYSKRYRFCKNYETIQLPFVLIKRKGRRSWM